jgi:hypothetical protein
VQALGQGLSAANKRCDDLAALAIDATVIADHIGTILVVTGVLTAAAVVGFVFPRPFLAVLVGMSTDDARTIVIGRHWGLLIGLIGGLLIYAAYHAEARIPIMCVAIIEKLALAAIAIASPLRRRPLTMTIVGADVVMALFFLVFLAQFGR